MSHKQNLEDSYIDYIFSDKEPGICVDIGFSNGDGLFSNISGIGKRYFEEKKWKYLYVEPNNNHISGETVTSLLDELNYSNDIDAITIKQNNSLNILDILKGIDFNKYIIKLFVIGNDNGSDNYIKMQYNEYLRNQGYIKINTIGTSDFYIKQYIPTYFNLISAYYYVDNYHEPANVTNKLNELYSLFRINNTNDTFVVSNELFTDTIMYSVKTLYINIEIKNKNKKDPNGLKQEKHQQLIPKTLEFIEGKIINWEELIEGSIFMMANFEDSLSTLIDVSFGEIMDRYSILEIQLKLKHASRQLDIIQIINELNSLSMYNDIKLKYHFFYKLLMHINEQIWLSIDTINQMDIQNKDPENILQFALTSNNIFVNNRKRLRLKNYFNKFIYSRLKNTSSYKNTFCYVDITDENTIKDKTPELNYLFLEYDHLYLNVEYVTTIQKTFMNPNMTFIDYSPDLNMPTIKLSDYTFDNDFRHIYEF
jgi:hypothetical protein